MIYEKKSPHSSDVLGVYHMSLVLPKGISAEVVGCQIKLIKMLCSVFAVFIGNTGKPQYTQNDACLSYIFLP